MIPIAKQLELQDLYVNKNWTELARVGGRLEGSTETWVGRFVYRYGGLPEPSELSGFGYIPAIFGVGTLKLSKTARSWVGIPDWGLTWTGGVPGVGSLPGMGTTTAQVAGGVQAGGSVV